MSSLQQTTELALKVRLSQQARANLIEQAARVGRGLDDYASDLLERAAAAPGVDAVLARLRKEFADSGKTDEQLIEEIYEAREQYHAERQKAG